MQAVYFGSYESDEYPLAIALDEFGFIYVAGTTNTTSTTATFALDSGGGYYFGIGTFVGTGLLYIKTHWDLNVELEQGPANIGIEP